MQPLNPPFGPQKNTQSRQEKVQNQYLLCLYKEKKSTPWVALEWIFLLALCFYNKGEVLDTKDTLSDT